VGTSFQSLVVRTSDYEEIKNRLVRWLSAKGFEQATGPALFERDREEDNERGLCLMAKDASVVVHYSHVLEEGDRLRFELTRPDWPLLKIWAYDSDIWGYELFDDGEAVTDFCSNPHYFGRMSAAESPSSANGDPERLCRALCLGPVEKEIAGLQRRRALFKEEVCRTFCRFIGVEPAGFDYRDFEGLVAPLSIKAGEWQVDHLRFVERGSSASESVQPLHAIVWKPVEVPDEQALQAEAALRAYFLPLRVAFWLLGVLLMPLILLMKLWFRLYFVFSLLPRMIRQVEDESDRSPFHQLRSLVPPEVRQEGSTLINDRHRCQITLPPGADADPGSSHWLHVFQFRVTGLTAYCRAIRPRMMHNILRESPYIRIVDDECFFVGDLQARAWTADTTHGGTTIEGYSAVIQTPRAFYQFSLSNPETLPADAKHIMRTIVESFRCF
jgi:hypothetical protein